MWWAIVRLGVGVGVGVAAGHLTGSSVVGAVVGSVVWICSIAITTHLKGGSSS